MLLNDYGKLLMFFPHCYDIRTVVLHKQFFNYTPISKLLLL